MDPNLRKKRPPPIPKFEEKNESTQSKVTQKVNTFLSQIEKEVSLHSESTAKPITDTKSAVEPKKVKVSALNSKLNSLLTSKKIDLNKMGDSIKKVNKTHEQEEKKDIDMEYDPKTPNSYEQIKHHYVALFEDLKKKTKGEEEKIQETQMEDEQSEIIEEESTQLEDKESIALRMMQKYGYRVGEGLGKNSQGITTPLTIKKTTDNSCIIEPSSISIVNFISAEEAAENALKAFKVQITKVVVVCSKMKAQQLSEQVESDIKMQCQKYGDIMDWLLYILGDQLRIFIKYRTRESSLKAYTNLNGRFYDERMIYTYFYDEDRFDRKELGDRLHQRVQF